CLAASLHAPLNLACRGQHCSAMLLTGSRGSRSVPCCPQRTVSALPHRLPGCTAQSQRRWLVSACCAGNDGCSVACCRHGRDAILEALKPPSLHAECFLFPCEPKAQCGEGSSGSHKSSVVFVLQARRRHTGRKDRKS